ncbi:DUF3987 domain-containing protein [Thermogemmatispora sp.]|uniref:DUF3987 domain-containing protein n=1 Tax=Thermogemmatispora sp. TaxID=1968838 RepID=UPI0035E42219
MTADLSAADQAMRWVVQRLWQGDVPSLPPADQLGAWYPLAQFLIEQANANPDQPALLKTVLAALSEREPAIRDWLAAVEPSGGEQETTGQRACPVMPSSSADLEEDEGMPPLPEEVIFPPEVSAGAWPSLDAYLEYSRQASPEAYDDFHMAVGLWVFSVVAARRIYLPLSKRVYPTLMVILVGRPSLFAKTTTAGVGRSLLQAAGLDWLLLPDRITPQKMLSDLAIATVPAGYEELPPAQQERLQRRLAMPGQRGWYVDEFGKFVRAALQPRSTTADFIELLLTLESCPLYFEHATLLRGGEVIERPSLAVLGSMTPASIRSVARPGAEIWHDGFLARFAFAVAPLREVHQQTFAPREGHPPQALVQALQRWHEQLGIPELRLDPPEGGSAGRHGGGERPRLQRGPLPEHACQISEDAYRSYDRYRRALREMLAASRQEDLDGAYGRLPELALKLALLNASLEADHPRQARIELTHWAKAQELAERFRLHLHRLHAQMRTAEEAGATDHLEDQLLAFLSRVPGEGATIRDIQRKAPASVRQTPAARLREALHLLVQSGEVELLQSGARLLYRLRGHDGASGEREVSRVSQGVTPHS